MNEPSNVADDFARPHDYIDFPHGRLAHWSFGEGPDLVMIHGWPLHGATFRRIIPRLSEGHRCHVFDLPGTGHTEWSDQGPVGLHEHARTISTALERLGIERCALLTHDSGGTIARLLMVLRPELADALVMGNTEIPGHALPGLKIARVAAGVPGAASVTRFMTGFRGVRERMFDGCFADLSQLDTDFGELFVEPMTNVAERPAEYVRGQLRFVQNLDWDVVVQELDDVHRQITSPVLLIWGDDDPWFPWRHAREMVDSFGGSPAEVHLMHEGKLFVHEEFADEFADVAADFLARAGQ